MTAVTTGLVSRGHGERRVVLLALAALVPLTWLVVTAPAVTAAALMATAAWTAVFLYPIAGTYLLVALTPLIVGINRGAVVPLVRPNEAVLLVVLSALFARWFLSLRRQPLRIARPNSFEIALAAVVVLGSVVPLLWMAARGLRPSQDDVFYALQFWKYLALYGVVRVTVTTAAQVRRTLYLSLATGALVVVVGFLQARGVGPVTEFLGRYYAPLGNTRITDLGRGSSTLASAIALGDFAVINLAIALALFVRGIGPRVVLIGAAVVFALGALSSGQFSGVAALVIGLVAIGLVTRSARRLYLASIPGVVVAVALLGPVIGRRLMGFQSPEGRPESWTGRMENLRRFFWPKLFGDYHWVLGVRPAGRVAAPSGDSWRDWVFIESGHTWLLWVGGVPLLIAFGVLLVVAGRVFWRVGRDRPDVVGAAAVEAFTAVCVIGVLTTTDAHLTMRGVADIAFPVFALALFGYDPVAPGEPPAAAAPARHRAVDPDVLREGGTR
jgi:hypothetical protein